MAYQYLTLLDVAKLNAGSMSIPLIEENLTFAPEVARFPAMVIPGTSYNTLQRTALPTGAFRNANEGTEPTKSAWANKLVECFIYESSMEMDVKVADANVRGAEWVLAQEANGHAQTAIQEIGSQIWYGTTVDAKGFPGAVSVIDSANVLDCGGATGTAASSVWGVKFGPQFASLVFGSNSTLAMRPWSQQFITRSSKELLAYKSNLSAWVGMQWVNKNALCRLSEITEAVPATDAKLARLLSQLPVGYAPDAWFMSRRTAYGLQAGRSAVTTALTGSTPFQFAPYPTDSNGIPIIVTDSIVNTETSTT